MATQNTSTTQLRDALNTLGEALRHRQLTAVIGPQALTVQIGTGDAQREAPFYRLVAERLLDDQQLPLTLLDGAGPAWDLHRATTAILRSTGISSARLRRTVSQTIRTLAQQVSPCGALAELARLDCFDLLVCLTPDDLLLQALQAAQPELRIASASYTPRADTSTEVDVPPASAGLLRMHHLLGRLEASPEFAIHEEDALEYLHRFRDDGERRAKTLLTDLRGKDRLFLGCGLPDWMGRGLTRLLNEQRLTTDERSFEFFCAAGHDASLAGFLDQFSANSIIFPWSPLEFVHEIAALSQHTPAAPPAPRAAPALNQRPSAFVSYASEDKEAAQRIADKLLSLGFGDVWLDRKKLVTGDDWADKIDDAIASCDYFIPLLSRQADQRREGVYWEEWRKAQARSLRINDAFLLPIGIDAQPPAKAGYERIFTGWLRPLQDLHLLHAPQGQLSSEECAQFERRVAAFAEAKA